MSRITAARRRCSIRLRPWRVRRAAQEAGVAARGVDADADMVAYARGGTPTSSRPTPSPRSSGSRTTSSAACSRRSCSSICRHRRSSGSFSSPRRSSPRRDSRGRDDQPAFTTRPSQLLRRPHPAQPLVPETLGAPGSSGRLLRGGEALQRAEERLTPPDDPLLARNVERLNEPSPCSTTRSSPADDDRRAQPRCRSRAAVRRSSSRTSPPSCASATTRQSW